jgi:hypothetical protein
MKTLIRFLFFAVCITLFATCQKADQVMDDLSGVQLKQAQPITVHVPFKAEAVTYLTSLTDDAECGSAEEGIFYVVNDGPGNATEMGKILFHCEFCVNTVNLSTFKGPGNLYFGAANGDRIYFEPKSNLNFMVPPEPGDPPYYLIKWHATYIITGGTGRFEGASGEIEGYGYNRPEPEYEVMSFHSFIGTLVLVKGKR